MWLSCREIWTKCKSGQEFIFLMSILRNVNLCTLVKPWVASNYTMHGDNNYPKISTESEWIWCRKDLEIWTTSSLKFSLHCDKAAACATKILGMLKRTFVSQRISKELFIFLYKTYVRPHLEYCVQLWCPYLAKDIDTLERVQRQATSLVLALTNLPYEKRLRELLCTVKDNVATWFCDWNLLPIPAIEACNLNSFMQQLRDLLILYN